MAQGSRSYEINIKATTESGSIKSPGEPTGGKGQAAKAEVKKDIQGVNNLAGKIKGDANGLLNFGSVSRSGCGSAPQTQFGAKDVTEIIKAIGAAVPKSGGDSNDPATGGERITGYNNLTGEVDGDLNGTFNFGSYEHRTRPTETEEKVESGEKNGERKK